MSSKVVSPAIYLVVFVTLICLTGVTVGVSQLPLGRWHLTIGLIIAAVKASLVLLFFMHLWYSNRLLWVVAASGVVFLAILLIFTMNDYLMRG